ncbi:Teichoic acid translocation permease protein TagG [Actinomadura rubteroloni]|uniref:Transport permease protein n=1 Tax=Actinomadura rubteroloni TaxID=1926885 RepID=A0A2P4UP86_9ACTN|nr:ABC transporter permease [Actinomadura rubteroloni]POM26867.1 Teichoic acid translocation permease protein TagG [Actinomadura rubteroloni]
MSHREPLGASSGEPVATLSDPAPWNGAGSASLAEFAAQHGLRQSAARPKLPAYVKALWQRRTFIWNLASAKTAATYSGSRLGQVWQILTPLLNAGVYYLIFGLLLGQNKHIHNYPAFLITGVFVFTFTQRSLSAGARSIGNNMSLIRALHFPRATLPLAYVIMELQQLLISMGVLIVIVLITGEPPSLQWLTLFPALVLQLIFNIGISMMVARLGAFIQDVQQLLPFITRTWLYFSGVFFMIAERVDSITKHGHHWIGRVFEANPAAVFIELVRFALLDTYHRDAAKYHLDHGLMWLYAVIWAVVAFVGGFWYFYRAEERYGRG